LATTKQKNNFTHTEKQVQIPLVKLGVLNTLTFALLTRPRFIRVQLSI